MKLLKLTLTNWRGVPAREIVFADGVTLIEGPNEIGKSTLVEALRTLFEELDSSLKKSVKAMQPIGQDVGSQVEAEITSGDCHFIYTKTYNKNKQTALHILAPTAEQLTGREAHERAEQILQSTMDMGLWNALLLEQGKEVSGVHLADSNGLARALDEAAGSTSSSEDDSDLYASIQAEYEQYFTLKTGKPKFGALETKLAETLTQVEDLRTALSAVETDTTDYERCVDEIRRLKDALPTLRDNVQKHEAHWRDINALQLNIAAKQSELSTADELLQAANDEQTRRSALADDLATSTQTLHQKNEQLAPLAEYADTLKKSSEQAGDQLASLKAALKQARTKVERAKDDEAHLKAISDLASESRRLKRLAEFQDQAEAERDQLAKIQIDTPGLDRLREAQSDLQVAIGKRNAVTSTVEVSAEQDLALSFNDEPLTLDAGAVEQRSVSAELHIGIPGVARIQILPSHSAAELEAEVVEREGFLTGLLAKYAVKDLAEAVATEAKRLDAANSIKTWNDKITDLLGDDSEEDIRGQVEQLQSRCDAYATARPDQPAIPETLNQASTLKKAAETALENAQEATESQQEENDRLRDDHSKADASYRIAIQELAGLEQAKEHKAQQLKDARSADSDQAVAIRVNAKTDIVKTVTAELETLNVQLDTQAPEAAQALLENAAAACKRAENDLQQRYNERAVLEDRLTQAQANGRFEALELAERELDELTSQHEATTDRAQAVERLWQTLNTHRDATRKAYVRPLKEGIEQLGKIVFGADFVIDLDDAWSLVSCTRHGLTVPFDDLSVGAREQLGILTRLAAARIVSSQGGVPLIIDDALGFSDPGRLETMGAAIASAGKETQIILLTCTPGRFTHVGSAQVVRL